MSDTSHTAQTTSGASWQSALIGALLGGITLGFIQVIVDVSFANLVFSGDASIYLPYGIGLMLIGGFITMVVVGLTTSAPGTSSSLQDSPAVVLAVIAASLMVIAPDALLPTLLAAICISTLLTGIVLWVLGQYRLGEIVRYIPYPVVGGFLAGTGLLLVIGGIGSMVRHSISTANLLHLLQGEELMLWGPGVVFGLVMFFGLRLIKNLMALPGLIMASIVVFYLVLFALGVSVEEAKGLGLLLGDLSSQATLQPPILTAFAGVDWPALLAQSGHIVVIILLNLVSLLLNVSGIELILDKEIDLNHELKSAGTANLLAGLAGSQSGYHTPTFTALSKRLSGETRLPALIAGGICGLTLIVGADVLAFMPKMILGGLLLFLGLDFINEWIIEGWRKQSRTDYFVVVMIMLVITFVGFLAGVGLGLLAMVAIFAVQYSRIGVLRSAASGAEIRSSVERPTIERQVLSDRCREIFIMELSGFIFFGTAYRLQRTLQARLADATLPKPRSVILDFRHVTGLDSSGAQIFRKMDATSRLAGVRLIFSGAEHHAARHLGSMPQVKLFPRLDEALEWAEEELLREVLGPNHHHTLGDYLTSEGLDAEISLALMLFFTEVMLQPGEKLIQAGEDAHELYFIQEGRVATYLLNRTGEPFRVSVMGPGTIVGEIGLYLQQQRSASVVAEEATTAFRLTDEALKRMKSQKPTLAAAFDEFMVRVLAERVIIASQRLAAAED
jgi:sulfate permease, SulP family